jgi:hypothetical protein
VRGPRYRAPIDQQYARRTADLAYAQVLADPRFNPPRAAAPGGTMSAPAAAAETPRETAAPPPPLGGTTIAPQPLGATSEAPAGPEPVPEAPAAPEPVEALVEAPAAAPAEESLGPQEQPLLDWALADRQVEDRRRALLSPAQYRRYESQVRAGYTVGRDLEEEGFVEAFLTNPEPGGHVAGTAATGLGVDWTMPEPYRDRVLERLYTADQEGLYRTETAATLRAIVGAMEDSVRLLAIGRAATEDEEEGPEVALGGRRPEPPMGLGFDPTTTLGQSVDVLIGTMPSAQAVTSSGLYRGVAYRMDLRRLAFQEALAEGLRGPALEARVAALETTPSQSQAARTVDVQTLRTANEELGPEGRRIARYAAEVPGGRLVGPYLRMPMETPHWFGPEAPVLSAASIQDDRDRAAMGRPYAASQARGALGRAVAASLAWNVADGRLTGRDADIEAQRVAPKRPAHTIRIGSEDVPYPAEPGTIGELVSAIATHAQIEALLPDRPEAYHEWTRLVPALTLATGLTLRDPDALEQVAVLLGAIRDHGAHASPLAPVAVAAVMAAGGFAIKDWVARAASHEATTLIGVAWDHAVAAYRDVPAYRDHVEGTPVWLPPGFGGAVVGPIVAEWATASTEDLVRQEMYHNDYVPPAYPWVVESPVKGQQPLLQLPGREPAPGEQGVELTHQERDRWRVLTTQEATIDGRNLKQALDYLMAADSPYWKLSPGPQGERRKAIHNVFTTYREAGKQMLFDPRTGSEHLQATVDAVKAEKRRYALPIDHPESPFYGKSELEMRRTGPTTKTMKELRRLVPSLGR